MPFILIREDYDVIRTLVSIEVDLASSLAIRFACQLGGLLDMEVHPIYVKESPSHDSAWGVGWASRTWEREMIEQGKEEISKMIAPEVDFCPTLFDPSVVYGDRHSEVLKVAQEGGFDLYLEGVDFQWTPPDLHKLAHMKFYQRLTCPIILVQSLRKMKQVLVLCLNISGTAALTRTFAKIWKGSSVPLVLAYPGDRGSGPEGSGLREKVLESVQVLEKDGCVAEHKQLDPEVFSKPTEDNLKDYGLVAIALERAVRKDNVGLEWLSLVKTASLITFY
jgi:hypothetical protein